METELFDENAPSRTYGLNLNSDLYSKVCEVGIDASRVAQEALIRALRAKDREKLLAEIRQDSEAVARYVETHGDPVADWEELFDPPDAA